MHLNEERLEELLEDFGMADFEDVLELFLEEVSGAIAALESDQEGQALENRFHFIKSSAVNMGLAGLSAMCQRGETAASSGCGNMPTQKEVSDEFVQSLSALDAWRGKYLQVT